MKFLICSDGTPQAEDALHFASLLARSSGAEATLLGIAENPEDREPLRAALTAAAEPWRAAGVVTDVVFLDGEPIAGIVAQTKQHAYDVVVIGSRRTGTSGTYWRSARTYEVIKAVPAPVLVAVGARAQLRRILVCTGGKNFIDSAVRLTAQIAAATGAAMTLLHVMAEPPAIYADLIRLEEDVAQLLASNSELGRNLRRQKAEVERLGISAEVRVRHGLVLDQVFAELEAGDYDMIVTGSSHARGPLRHYIMGDLTREIVNRADCPVLVARPSAAAGEATLTAPGILRRFVEIFAPRRS